MSIWVFLGLLGVYIAALTWSLIKASQKGEGRVKFELKKSQNYWRPVVHMIWACYFIVWGVLQIPGVTEWSAAQIAANPEYGPDTSTYYIYAAAPYVALITIFVVAWWFVVVSFKPWIKYSEQERVWLKEEKGKLREQLQKWFGRRIASLVK